MTWKSLSDGSVVHVPTGLRFWKEQERGNAVVVADENALDAYSVLACKEDPPVDIVALAKQLAKEARQLLTVNP